MNYLKEISTITRLHPVEQLVKKLEKITLIDEQFLKLYNDEHELEAEELQDDITDKVARVKRYHLELKSTIRADRVSPLLVSQMQSKSTDHTQLASNVEHTADIPNTSVHEPHESTVSLSHMNPMSLLFPHHIP